MRGSYSSQTIDYINLNSISFLREPAMDGRLLFGREATHKTFFSTVHGAIQSGYREAERIIAMIG